MTSSVCPFKLSHGGVYIITIWRHIYNICVKTRIYMGRRGTEPRHLASQALSYPISPHSPLTAVTMPGEFPELRAGFPVTFWGRGKLLIGQQLGLNKAHPQLPGEGCCWGTGSVGKLPRPNKGDRGNKVLSQ